MKVLLVGAGGREHALAWRLRLDNPTTEIVAAPGNPDQVGTEEMVFAEDVLEVIATSG